MRLTITLPDLEKGSTIITGREERRIDIARECKQREPFAIVPVRDHDGRMIAAIIPTGEVNELQQGTEIKFRPIWAKTFLVCAARKDSVTHIVIESDFGQYMIDKEGFHKSKLTTGGYGTDPKVIISAELELGRLIDAEGRSDVIYQLMQFLKRSF